MVLSLMTLAMWLGAAVWVYLDAAKTGRAPIWNAVATFFLPGIGLAVYLGVRAGSRSDQDDRLSRTGQELLRDLTQEVTRLRARIFELEEAANERPGGGP